MNKKFFALMTILIGMVSILVGLYSVGVFSVETDFDTEFMSGTIHGEAFLNTNHPRYSPWWVNYEDKSNNINYTFLVLKNGTFLKDVFKFSGFQKIGSQKNNGVKWNIYYLKSKRSSHVPNNENSSISESQIFYYNYLCTARKNGTDYFIFVYSSKIKGSDSNNSDLYSNYLNPLLKTVKVKKVDDPPTFQEVYKTSIYKKSHAKSEKIKNNAPPT